MSSETSGSLPTPMTCSAAQVISVSVSYTHLDVKALVFIIGLIILNGLVYYPFFKAYEKKKVEEEQAEAPAQAEVA